MPSFGRNPAGKWTKVELIVGANLRLRYTQFLVLVLELVELKVNATLGQKLLMRAHFAHMPFVHDDDLIGTLDRG